ncbi:MAG: AAA family ATPase [Pseudomonadota bacterium]
MIVLLNGPLGIGKSTLAEALMEALPQSVALNGDALLAFNPPPEHDDAILNQFLRILIERHRQEGRQVFIVDHLWTSPEDIEKLIDHCARPGEPVRTLLLTLPKSLHRHRIEQRARARALDELGFELSNYLLERQTLAAYRHGEVGKPIDVTAPVEQLVSEIRQWLNAEIS